MNDSDRDRAPRPLSRVPSGLSAREASAGMETRHSFQALREQREFVMSAADFERIRQLIARLAGIVLSEGKQDMVYNRLAGRLRSCGESSFSRYLERLERDKGEQEAFVNALTTNLTSFFRESHHFDILAEQLRRISDARPIRIWCCAASTGEEPYSLAMLACEAFNSLSPPVQILASDIDTAVLAHGEAGKYRPDRIAALSAERRARFFVSGGRETEGVVEVRPELRRLISFRRINLLDSVWSVSGPQDVIFCRNVMIYFDKPTQHAILKRFAAILRPEGQLYAGHSESFAHASDVVRSKGRTVYVRLDSPLK